jgi:hypothetical protein
LDGLQKSSGVVKSCGVVGEDLGGVVVV